MKTIYKNTIYAFILFAMLMVTVPIAGQTTNTSYFMKTSSKRMMLNPAFQPEQAYLGMPFVLNNLNADVKTNTINMDHLTFLQDGELYSFMHRNVDADQFLSGISKNNYLDINFNYSLFSLGWFRGKNFWNVDWNVRVHSDANLPYSAFEMFKKGIAMNEPSFYNLKEMRVSAQAYSELGVTHSRPFLNDKLIVGAKAKFLLGLGNADFHLKDMVLDAGLDEWIVRSHATLRGSAPGIYPENDEEGKFDSFGWGEKFAISGYGLGFDVGATYSLSHISGLFIEPIENIFEKLTFSMSFTDMGFISWSKNNSTSLSASMEDQVITGDFEIDFDDSNSLEEDFDKIKDTLEDIINFQEDGTPRGRTTGLRTNMNFGLEYEILKNKLSAGLLSTTYFNTSHTVTEATLTVNYRPIKWFESALSYSFVHSRFNTFGLALNFAPTRGVHFFIASDYIIPNVNSEFMPVKSKALNFQLGLAVPLGQRRN